MLRCIKCEALSSDSAQICEKCGSTFQEQMVTSQGSHKPGSIRTNTRKSPQLKKDQQSFLMRLLAPLGITYSTQTGKRVIPFIVAIITLGIVAVAVILGPVLKVYPPFTSAPHQATVPPDAYHLATSGTPALTDPLAYNSRGNGWAQSDNCTFSGTAYHITDAQPGTFAICTAAPILTNFALQVQMTVLSGDFGGIIFRTNQQQPYGYRFAPRTGGNLVYGDTQLATFSTPINPKQTYLLTVIARGSSIWLYVDKHLLAHVQDSSASSGGFGFLAGDFSNATDIAFTNLQVWTL